MGGVDSDQASSITVDSSDNVIVAGTFLQTADFGGTPLVSAGSYDMFAAKYSATGAHLWSKRFGTVGGESSPELAVDGAGNASLTGYFNGTIDFGNGPLISAGSADVFLLSLRP
jgi:hypothetical protein